MLAYLRKLAVNNPLSYLFIQTWHYSEGNRKTVALFWTMFIVTEAADVFLFPLIWANVMTSIQNHGVSAVNIKMLVWSLIALVVANAFFWLLHWPARLMERTNAFLVRINYRKHLMKGVMLLPMEWHNNNHSGSTIDKIEKGTSGLYSFAEDSFEVIYSIVKFGASLCLLAYFFPPSIYLVAGMMMVMGTLVVKFDKTLVTQYKKINECENGISARIIDSITNITTVIILRIEKLVFDAMIKKAMEPFELFKKSNYLNEFKWAMVSICCTITVSLVMGLYFFKNYGAAGGVLIGNVYLLYRYLGNITDTCFRFTSLYGDIVQRRTRVANAEGLAKEFRSESFANHVLPSKWQTLEIRGLTFSYEDKDAPHLDDVSLTIRHGEKIAFIGKSGSGKTTLLRLMRDLFHPKKLRLSVDGKAIPHGFEGIANAISLVPQSPEIFASSVWENITLGAEYEKPFVLKFTDMACFTDVALALPKQFESAINEKGVNLSGGQQQRLALARGLLACHNKDIVLLDEPTSSLDAVTERTIYENVFRSFDGKTIVSTIHRLHLLMHFDRVCMFEDGKIVGLGTFDELSRDCPQFRELWSHYEGSQDKKAA